MSRLRAVGVSVDFRFEDVVETGKVVLDALLEGKERIGGEAVLKIGGRYDFSAQILGPKLIHFSIDILSALHSPHPPHS